MEIALHPKLPSQVILGPRQSDQGGLEQVLVAIVKGTFSAADPNAELKQLPIFQKDIFFNWARNGDFSVGPQVNGQGEVIAPVAAWEAQGPSIQVRPDPPEYLEVTGAGRVIQTVGFDRPLAGRTYRFSFKARSSVPTTVRGIRVETPSGVVGFESDFSFSDEFPVEPYASPVTWPATTEDSEATIVLRGSDEGVVDYDQVQLTEGATALSFDANDPILYEHDLAAYKPYADIVVLGRPARPELVPEEVTWEESVAMNGSAMIGEFNESGGLTSLRFAIDGPTRTGFSPSWSAETPITFGWESRVLEHPDLRLRKDYAGTYHAENDTWEGFDNRFFNGGLYALHEVSPEAPEEGWPVFSYLPNAATVDITTQADYRNGSGTLETRTATRTLRLPSWSPNFAVSYRIGATTSSKTVQENTGMHIDTLVYNKDTQEFYVVWRGVWPYASVPADRYVRVKLS